MIIKTDILIIGAGSAGFGAAYSALSEGKKSVVLADKNNQLGGTSTVGGVNTWEPGIGGDGVHYRLAERLMRSGDAFVGRTVSYAWAKQPYAVSDRCDDSYETTLHRYNVSPDDQRRFHFEPDAMSREMLALLREADNDGPTIIRHTINELIGNNAAYNGKRLTLLFGCNFKSVETRVDRIIAVSFDSADGEITVFPKTIIDSSADIVCARAAGCAYMTGEDSCDDFGEESAPINPVKRLNGLTQCFRIAKGKADTAIPEEYSDTDLSSWKQLLETRGVVSCFNVYPRGGISVNMLPTIDGIELLNHPIDELKHICEARVYIYWQWLTSRYGYNDWHIEKIFPMLGIRESYRLHGRYVLTHNDLIRGYAESLGHSHTIARADHPTDIHGDAGGLRQTGVYEIPYDCMLPKEFSNLLVACRGASFSHLAASSARLSRTMLAIGEAAGRMSTEICQNL